MKHKTRTRNEELAAEVSIRILKLREQIYAGLTSLLKAYHLTEPQYNVLRILRGAEPDGLPCLEIGRRMITRVPDVTRLLDRLETQALIGRSRSHEDRRVVLAKITTRGRNLLKNLDGPILRYHRDLCASLSRKELTDIIALVDKLTAP